MQWPWWSQATTCFPPCSAIRPQELSCFWPGRAGLDGCCGSAYPGQGFAFAIVELHCVPLVPFLQPVHVPLNGSPVLKHITWFPSPSPNLVSSANLMSVFYCLLQAVYEEDKQSKPWNRPLLYSTCYWSSGRICGPLTLHSVSHSIPLSELRYSGPDAMTNRWVKIQLRGQIPCLESC